MAKTSTKKTKAPSPKESNTHKTGEHIITKKRSGRYLVHTLKGKVVNGMDKTRILVAAKLVQAGFPKDGSSPKAADEAAAPTQTE